ncbi:uncharacterized protein LOC9640714 isoform X2 [Selaginella moellendorffii]|uniref:uncharacterized protein LOC9640714 isoform X2 n=1 Tax=Selaginella moellendorffii TaxID=88036 RepID=UPI000D1CA6C4|nr:uncharacterized protein LOC9640714 isoform X2 [Selaginella moellendorffii]|eukprot:XP_024532843.1 uncharacterized protein LOC9640714 isoform X2 [Selaginella moellendorffii]
MWPQGGVAAATLTLGFGALGIAGIGILTLAVHPTWLVRIVQTRQRRVLFLDQRREKHELLVALTLDDGPHRDITHELLDILEENHSKATWFLIGSNMDKCPEVVERIYKEGHEVGNHTMYDCASWRLSPEEFTAQLLATERRLEPFFRKGEDGKPWKWFRPGHGFYNREMIDLVEGYGYKLVLGSLYPLDTLFRNKGKLIAKYLLWRL